MNMDVWTADELRRPTDSPTSPTVISTVRSKQYGHYYVNWPRFMTMATNFKLTCMALNNCLIVRATNRWHFLKCTHNTVNCRYAKTFAGRRRVENYYKVLQIDRNASPVQVKAAYFRLSKQYHPDVNSSADASSRFTLISEAYSVLGNKSARSAYDGTTNNQAYTSGKIHEDMQPPQRNIIVTPPRYRNRVDGPPLGHSSIYNYDEFYRQHYRQSIDLKRRMNDADEHWERWLATQSEVKVAKHAIIYMAMLLVIITMYVE